MALNRATITLTLDQGEAIDEDAFIDQANPSTEYGLLNYLSVGGKETTPDFDDRRTYMKVSLPSKPEDCDDSAAYDGIISITLKLYLFQFTSTSTSPQQIQVFRSLAGTSWVEATVDWDAGVGDGRMISQQDITLTSPSWASFDLTEYRKFSTWGDQLDFKLKDTRDQAAKFTDFYSRQRASNWPQIVITYAQLPPAQITDFTIAPDPNDATRPVLTWTPSSDDNFDHYEIYRNISAGGWIQIGSDLTIQGQNEFTDTSPPSPNNLTYYKIREVNGDGSYNESNEVWFIRPAVSTFTVSDTTPDVLQELTFTVAASAYPTTPSPVSNVSYKYIFGTSSQNDSSTADVLDLTRTHRYPYYGSQTPKVQITNSLGYKSDEAGLTSGGPTLTVSDLVPIAVIKASPVKVGLNEVVRFFGDESYAPAGNREIAATNGYEWDKDYSVSFVADDTTTVPYQDYSWTGAGTKTVALRVKDAASVYSAEVTIQVVVEAVSTVDLDALVDGYEVIDVERSRTIIVQEGIEAKSIRRGSERIVGATISGFAFTDVDADDVPDDIETLEDIVVNNKRVQLSIHGTVRYGALSFRTHTEGGWDDKYNWTATIVLE